MPVNPVTNHPVTSELYRSIDLPVQPYIFAEWKRARVSIDYHIDLKRHYYSVPYQLVGKEVDARFTGTTFEILYQGKRVASHAQQPPGQAFHASGASPKSAPEIPGVDAIAIVEWVATIGPLTAELAGG